MTLFKLLFIALPVHAFSFLGLTIGEPESLVKPMPNNQQITTCIESLCGPASSNVSGYTAAMSQKPDAAELDRLWKSRLEPNIRIYVAQDARTKAAFLDRLDAIIQKGKIDNENAPTKIFAIADSLKKKYYAPIQANLATIDKDSVSVTVNQSIVDRTIAKIADPRERDAVRLLWLLQWKLELEETFTQIKPTSDHYSLSNRMADRLKARYPDLAPAQAEKVDAQMALDQIANFQKIYGEAAAEILFDKLWLTRRGLTDALAGKEFDNVDSEAYVLGVNNVARLSNLTNPELMAALQAIPYNTSAEISSPSGKKAMAFFRSQLTPSSLETRMTDLHNACNAHAATADALSPKPQDYSALEARVKRAKDAARIVLPQLVGPEYGAIVAGHIDTTEFIPPDDKQDNFKRLREDVLGANQSVFALERLILDPTRTSDADIFFLLAAMVQDSFTTIDPIVTECNALPSGAVGDATFSSWGRIYLSWFTLRYPQFSLAILSHEFGHAMGYYLRKIPAFGPLLSCVANRNPYVIQPVTLSGALHYTADPRWTEEDWGDYFSSQILNTLNSQEPDMGCLLLEQDQTGYVNNTYYQSNPGDVHSAALFRLLMLANDRHQMTEACKPLVAYAPAHNRDLQCRPGAVVSK